MRMMPKTMIPLAVILAAPLACNQNDRSRPIAEGQVIDILPGAVPTSGARIEAHWTLEGNSGRPNISCDDQKAATVIARVRRADKPNATGQSFRMSCQLGRAVLPLPEDRYPLDTKLLLKTQLLGVDGQVLSTTPDQEIQVQNGPLEVPMLFGVQDGFVIKGGRSSAPP